MGPGQAIGGLVEALLGGDKEGEKKSPGFIAQKVGERAVDEGRQALGRMSFGSPHEIGQTVYNLDKHIKNAPGNLVDRFFDPFRAQPEPEVALSAKRPRGVRNNNPGNIKRGSSNWLGSVSGPDETFVTFRSPEYGIRATAKLLQNYQNKHGLNTIDGIIKRWAPAGVDNNSTANYISSVSEWTGYAPNAQLDLKDRATLEALTTAMARYENGGDFYDNGVISSGVGMLFGRRDG